MRQKIFSDILSIEHVQTVPRPSLDSRCGLQVQPSGGAVPGAEQEVGRAEEDPLQDPGRDHG